MSNSCLSHILLSSMLQQLPKILDMIPYNKVIDSGKKHKTLMSHQPPDFKNQHLNKRHYHLVFWWWAVSNTWVQKCPIGFQSGWNLVILKAIAYNLHNFQIHQNIKWPPVPCMDLILLCFSANLFCFPLTFTFIPVSPGKTFFKGAYI